MKKLFLFELRKILRQKSFYICTAVMIGLVFLTSLIQKVALNFSGAELGGMSCVPIILSAAATVDFAIVNGIFIALYVCHDFTSETIKNIYARGFSKTKVFLSKLTVAFAATAIQFVCLIVFSAIFGLIFFGAGEMTGKYFLLLVAQLIACLSLASFSFALSYTFKRTGVAIALSILAAEVIGLVLTLITALLKIQTFDLGDYWISGFLPSLSDWFIETKRIVICIVLSIAYGAAFIAAAWLLDRKHDV